MKFIFTEKGSEYFSYYLGDYLLILDFMNLNHTFWFFIFKIIILLSSTLASWSHLK